MACGISNGPVSLEIVVSLAQGMQDWDLGQDVLLLDVTVVLADNMARAGWLERPPESEVLKEC